MMTKPVYHNVPLSEKEMEGLLLALELNDWVRLRMNMDTMTFRSAQRVRGGLNKQLKKIDRAKKKD